MVTEEGRSLGRDRRGPEPGQRPVGDRRRRQRRSPALRDVIADVDLEASGCSSATSRAHRPRGLTAGRSPRSLAHADRRPHDLPRACSKGRCAESLLGKAIEAGVIDVRVHDIRDHADEPHRQVDDEPFGGGPGMVMKPEPMFAAVEALDPDGGARPLSPAGTAAGSGAGARALRRATAGPDRGRYEGVDERVVEGLRPRRSRSATTSCPAASCPRWS